MSERRGQNLALTVKNMRHIRSAAEKESRLFLKGPAAWVRARPPTAVERPQHKQHSQGQILASAFRQKPSKLFKLFPLRSTAALKKGLLEHLSGYEPTCHSCKTPQQSHPLSPPHEPLHRRAKRDPKAKMLYLQSFLRTSVSLGHVGRN